MSESPDDFKFIILSSLPIKVYETEKGKLLQKLVEESLKTPEIDNSDTLIQAVQDVECADESKELAVLAVEVTYGYFNLERHVKADTPEVDSLFKEHNQKLVMFSKLKKFYDL